MMLVFDVIALALGLAFGSFANVLISRIGNDERRLSSPSSCTSCGVKILRRDNIPVLSWLLLRGRCRSCNQIISGRYPLIELAAAGLFVLVLNFPALGFPAALAQLERSPQNSTPLLSSVFSILAVWWFICASLALATIDFQTFRLPNSLVLSLVVAGLMGFGISSLLVGDFEPLTRAFFGMVICVALFGVIILVSPGGMGLGDLKLSAAIGLYLGWFGWGALIFGLLFAFSFGAIFGLSLLVRSRAHRRSEIAFGPWMQLGALTSMALGNELWSDYLSFVERAVG